MAADEPIVVIPGEGAPTRTPFGDTLRFLVGADETRGGYSLHDRTAPPGSRSTPHVHNRVSEAFYVIDGALELEVGSHSLTGVAGTFVLAPPGVMHAWRNPGENDARILVIFSPPVAYEYFEELDRLTAANGGRADPAAITALAQRYGLD